MALRVRLWVNEVDAHVQLGDMVEAGRAYEAAVRHVEAGDAMNLLNLAIQGASLRRDADCVEMLARFAEGTGEFGRRDAGQTALDYLSTQAAHVLLRMDPAIRAAFERQVDPVLAALRTAPVDDEPFTIEDERLVEEGRSSLRRGEGVRSDQLLRDLDLEPHP